MKMLNSAGPNMNPWTPLVTGLTQTSIIDLWVWAANSLSTNTFIIVNFCGSVVIAKQMRTL